VGDALDVVLKVVIIVCLIGMGVSSFRTLNRTSRTNEPAPRSMYLTGAVFGLVGIIALITQIITD
jgi:TRAP-type C4-dicarboxylate transport system permease small subunit